MLLMGDEQDINKREAAIAARVIEENNDFILSISHSPAALWCQYTLISECVSHFSIFHE